MRSDKREKTILLVKKIEETRSELTRLEAELDRLFLPPRRIHRVAKVVQSNGRKPTKHKLHVLRVLKNAEGPVKLAHIQAQMKCCYSRTQNLMNELIEEGLAYRPSYGMYAAKIS